MQIESQNPPKLWLTFMTCNRKQDIEEMLDNNVYDYFDGIIAVDHYSIDGTYELLESKKKAGKIIQRAWVQHHSHSMNEFLFAGIMKNFDFFLILDSSDRINLDWLKGLRNELNFYIGSNVGAIYLDRVYLARYFDWMQFFGSPHWGLSGISGLHRKMSDFSDNYKKENYIINTRGTTQEKFEQSALLHPAKYWYCYAISNQVELLYGRYGNQVVSHHEELRQWFRLYAQNILKLELTLESLEQYFRAATYTFDFIEYVELEVNMKDIFRLKILKQDLISEIAQRRFDWSFKHFLKTGDVKQENTGYKGITTQYAEKMGIEAPK